VSFDQGNSAHHDQPVDRRGVLRDADGFDSNGINKAGFNKLGFNEEGVNAAGQRESDFPPAFLNDLRQTAEVYQARGWAWSPPVALKENEVRARYSDWYSEVGARVQTVSEDKRRHRRLNEEEMSEWLKQMPPVEWRNGKWVGSGPPPKEKPIDMWRRISRVSRSSSIQRSVKPERSTPFDRQSRASAAPSMRSTANRESAQRELTAMLSSVRKTANKF
jgi:hypothetical protein